MTVVDAPATTDLVFEIRDLSTSFFTHRGVVEAVVGVDLDVRRGRCLCVVGESGSGKTVLSRSLLQLVDAPGRIVSGSVVFCATPGRPGVDLAKLTPKSPELRRVRGGQVSMVFQEPMAALSPVHTIGAQMAEMLLLHERMSPKEVRERAEAELLGVGLVDPRRVYDSYSFELSGGMRQRAMIAMALSTRPAVLIADEPTTALDVTSQARVLDLLRERTTELGMTMVFVTHDLGVVAEIADDVCVMRSGRIVEAGAVDQIFHEPRASYTQQLLAARPHLRGRARTEDRQVSTEAPAALTPSVLEVENVSVAFEARRRRGRRGGREAVDAVRSVSLTVPEGSTLGIVGESGSGKTTLARAVMGVHRPVSGRIRYRRRDGGLIDVSAADKAQLRELRTDVRMIFQDPYGSLNPRLTVRQILAESLVVNDLASGSELHDRVEQALRDVMLSPDVLRRYPHEFSGGQRQRIGIARALVTRPRVVIADEAVSALDVSVRAQILDLLAELQERLGLTYLFISHDLSVVGSICSEVVVMRRGEVVEHGDRARLFAHPQHEYTRTLLDAIPVTDPRRRTHRPTRAPESSRGRERT